LLPFSCNIPIDNLAALRDDACMEATTGLDLKLKRTAARATQRELAEHMGVKGQFISQIESRAVVRQQTADRYLAALAAVANGRAA
jgi:DNA-binding XRE family transcriptional regulator